MLNRKTTGAVVMSAIIMIGFYTLILNNTNGLKPKEETAVTPTPVNAESTLKVVDQSQPQQSSSGSDEAEPMMQQMNQRYNNGSFSTDSDFFTPSGEEGFNVALEIEDDQIVSVSTTFSASHPHSEAINERLFKPGINGVVEGKEVDKATLRFPVNGASLHSAAFNQALENIKKEALISSHNISYNN